MESEDTDVAEKDPSGRFIRFHEILGKGAWKTVYKAFDEVDGIEVAWNQVQIKDVVRSQAHLEMLHTEVHLLKSLKHENIIKYYFSWVDDAKRTINIITELFTSGSLRKYRKKHKNVDLKAIKNWARQVLRGLLYLHSHSPPIIHRDLKCDNIFINGNTGKVKIGDLGLAVVMDQPTVHTIIGTPEFMAPELYEEDYNELVDIYSFGMCIMEMVTLEYPYCECENPCQIYKKVTSGIKPVSLSKVGNPEVKKFIEKCLLPASLRPSAAELLKDPFLNSDTPGKVACVKQSHLMDIDTDGKNCTSSSECINKSPPTTIEISRSNQFNSFCLFGKEYGDDAISMTLLAKVFGQPKNVHFEYYLEKDTIPSIASEMVVELGLEEEDAVTLADMMNELILKITSRCISNHSSKIAVEAKAVVPEPMKFHTDGDSSLSEVHNRELLSDGVSKADMAVLSLDDDEKCEELKMEEAAIYSEYNRLVAEAERLKTEALERARLKWVAKKIPVN